MSKTLDEIAQELKNNNKKVQLIYAFNGTGKTRLSKTFKQLIVSNPDELARNKILYYNAFTEDLFYWDNDLNEDREPKLKIQPNSFTDWVLKEQAQDQNIITHFQRYSNEKLTPRFNSNLNEITFSFTKGNDEIEDNIKISKGEESNFIWCVFYALLAQVIAELNIPEADERSTQDFNNLEYVFIDDPVSSLDENHLIQLAIDLALLINSTNSLRFIISTHNALFYNVLYNELGLKSGYLLARNDDGTFQIDEKKGDSNKAFSYHLFLKQTLENAIMAGEIQKYHFTLLRNLYEKTANFLNYPKWSELLPEDKNLYVRQINRFSHSTLSNEEVAEPTREERNIISYLLEHLVNNYSYYKPRE